MRGDLRGDALSQPLRADLSLEAAALAAAADLIVVRGDDHVADLADQRIPAVEYAPVLDQAGAHAAHDEKMVIARRQFSASARGSARPTTLPTFSRRIGVPAGK